MSVLSTQQMNSVLPLNWSFLSKMDGSWLDDDHHDFLEELKMEILEEKKKEGILQRAGRRKQVSVTVQV